MIPKKKRPSGPSGRNVQPQRLLRAPAEFWAQVDAALGRTGEPWSQWARRTLAAAADLELKKEPG